MRREVARLGLQAPEPRAMAQPPQRAVGLLGQGSVVVGVAAADLGGVGPGAQALGGERADRLEHPRTEAALGLVEAEEAVA